MVPATKPPFFDGYRALTAHIENDAALFRVIAVAQRTAQQGDELPSAATNLPIPHILQAPTRVATARKPPELDVLERRAPRGRGFFLDHLKAMITASR
jgi:hypothetical protein